MTDEIKPVEQIMDESEFPFVKVVCRPEGVQIEISGNMSSVMLLGIAAQLEIMGRMQFGDDLKHLAQQNSSSRLEVVRSIPQDHRKRRN